MPIDKDSPIHLYIQIADSIRSAIASGAYPPGTPLPTEHALCAEFGVSRYPMRQAMAILVKEGLLCRSRGKGTFVNGGERRGRALAADIRAVTRVRAVAIVLPGITGDFSMDILRGFERAAAELGYAAFIAVAGAHENEAAAVARVAENGASGVVIFPRNNTMLNEDLFNEWIARGVYVSIIDRNPGLEHIDYVGSDNFGGGYLAAHHMSLAGYRAAVYVADQSVVSSVRERCSGFHKGLQRFGMRALYGGQAEGSFEPEDACMSFQAFVSALSELRRSVPFGVFVENDMLAEKVLDTLAEHGFAAGSEVGVIGFDNSTRCDYLTPKLTSVAQNGYLIGETAARLAIEKIGSGSRQSVRHILPTQLAARRSCGEGRADK